jgi:hypothetical protein
MDAVAIETEAVRRTENRPICTWKLVLMNNLKGEGTSFDPANLNPTVHQCLWCDGFEGECHLYTS